MIKIRINNPLFFFNHCFEFNPYLIYYSSRYFSILLKYQPFSRITIFVWTWMSNSNDLYFSTNILHCFFFFALILHNQYIFFSVYCILGAVAILFCGLIDYITDAERWKELRNKSCKSFIHIHLWSYQLVLWFFF